MLTVLGGIVALVIIGAGVLSLSLSAEDAEEE
jgi:hypothetical protein